MHEVEEKLFEFERMLGMEAQGWNPTTDVTSLYFKDNKKNAKLFFYGIGVFQKGLISKEDMYHVAFLAGATRGFVDGLLAQIMDS